MFKSFYILFAAVLVVLFSGCKSTVENNDRTALELCRYMMQQVGGTFDGAMAVDPIHADDGFALKIADRQVGDWNRFHVIMRGEKVTVWLNGELVVDNVTLENYWDRSKPIFPKEQIELQCHGDPTEWRNIFIKEL